MDRKIESDRILKRTLLYLSIAFVLVICLSNIAIAGVRGNNGQLIETGDPQYRVEQGLGEPFAKHQLGAGRWGSGNESYAYYKKDGQTIEIRYVDGHVNSIDGSRNRR